MGEDAEDVASETWLQVARDLGGFRGSYNGFRGWVVTVGRHRALDHLRREGRRPPAVLVPTEDLASLAAADDTAAGALEAVATDARVLTRLRPTMASRILGELPAAVLPQLAPSALARLPSSVLATLPPSVLAKLRPRCSPRSPPQCWPRCRPRCWPTFRPRCSPSWPASVLAQLLVS